MSSAKSPKQTPESPVDFAKEYPEVQARLCAEFADVKTRQAGKGRTLSYITARQAMNRLDEVIGWTNWWDDYVEHATSVVCRLTIRLPDGRCLTKADAGGFAPMEMYGDKGNRQVDEKSRAKSGYSDAFKRAAAKFGVGRYLYRDGIPRLARTTATKAAPPPRNGDVPVRNDEDGQKDYPYHGPQASPVSADDKAVHVSQVRDFEDWLKTFCAKVNGNWVDSWKRDFGGAVPEGVQMQLINTYQLMNHLVKWKRGPDFEGNHTVRMKIVTKLWCEDYMATKDEATAYVTGLGKKYKLEYQGEPTREPGQEG